MLVLQGWAVHVSDLTFVNGLISAVVEGWSFLALKGNVIMVVFSQLCHQGSTFAQMKLSLIHQTMQC